MTKVTIFCENWPMEDQMKMVQAANDCLKNSHSFLYPGEYLDQSWDFQVFQDADLLALQDVICRQTSCHIYTTKASNDSNEIRYIWYLEKFK